MKTVWNESNLLTIMSFQTHMALFVLWNTHIYVLIKQYSDCFFQCKLYIYIYIYIYIYTLTGHFIRNTCLIAW